MSMPRPAWSLSLLFVMASLQLALLAPAMAQAPVGGEERHVVRSGETLGSIASSAKVPLADLQAANGIADPGKITTGQTLIIPTTTTTPPDSVPSPSPQATVIPSSTPQTTDSPPTAVPLSLPAGAAQPGVPVTTVVSGAAGSRSGSRIPTIAIAVIGMSAIMLVAAGAVWSDRRGRRSAEPLEVRPSGEPPKPSTDRSGFGSPDGTSPVGAAPVGEPVPHAGPGSRPRVDQGETQRSFQRPPTPERRPSQRPTPAPPTVHPHPTGESALLGVVQTDLDPEGFVEAGGVWWQASSSDGERQQRGARVVITVDSWGRHVAAPSGKGA